jgi:biofilm PGA synthesis protein PgaD
MDQSRQRITVIHPRDLIINAAHCRPLWARWRDWLLTLGLWATYAVLVRDVFQFISAAVWRAFSNEAGLSAALPPMFVTLSSYMGVIAFNGALFIGWAVYNQLRFRGMDRRKSAPAVRVEDVAGLYGFTVTEVEHWRGSRIVIVHHDGVGKLVEVYGYRPVAPHIGEGGRQGVVPSLIVLPEDARKAG